MFSSRSGRSSDLLVMVDAVDDVAYWHKADIEDGPKRIKSRSAPERLVR
jgi:hypothetical protein